MELPGDGDVPLSMAREPHRQDRHRAKEAWIACKAVRVAAVGPAAGPQTPGRLRGHSTGLAQTEPAGLSAVGDRLS